MGLLSSIINTVKNVVSSVGSALGLSSGTSSSSSSNTQLGSVIVKPSEVSSVSKGTSYSVPETGVSGVSGGSSSQTSKAASSSRDLVPSGNIQTELSNSQTELSNSQTTSEVSSAGSTTQNQSISGGVQTNQTIQTSKGNATVTQVNNDGSYTYKTEDGQFTYVDANGKESTLYSGGAMPITAGDIMTVIGVAGLVKGLAFAAYNALTASFARIGTVAITSPATLSSIIPEATGQVIATSAGKVAINSATNTLGLKVATTAAGGGAGFAGVMKVGALIALAWQTAGQYKTQTADQTTYLKDSGDLAVQLLEVGMTDEANQIYQTQKEVNSYFKTIAAIPILGTFIDSTRIKEAIVEMDNFERDYEKQNQILLDNQTEQKVLDERAYKEQQLQEQRRYDEQQLAEKRAYEEQIKEEERAYEEEKAAREAEAAAEAAYASEATATEGTGGSTLTFGILNSGGDTEYVDIQKASQYYFGKAYEELTEAQKRLLMLSKGSQ